MESQNCGILTKYIWGAPIKREFLLLYLIIKMSSIFRPPQLFSDAFPVKGRQNSVKILHRSQSSLPLISFSSGRGFTSGSHWKFYPNSFQIDIIIASIACYKYLFYTEQIKVKLGFIFGFNEKSTRWCQNSATS